MHCKHCGFINGEDDHRCLRCGRRFSGVVIAAPAGYSGANALAPVLLVSDGTDEFPPVQPTVSAQPVLFTEQFTTAVPNVIPFERRGRQPAARPPVGTPLASPTSPTRAAARRMPAPSDFHQASLDFL